MGLGSIDLHRTDLSLHQQYTPFVPIAQVTIKVDRKSIVYDTVACIVTHYQGMLTYACAQKGGQD